MSTLYSQLSLVGIPKSESSQNATRRVGIVAAFMQREESLLHSKIGVSEFAPVMVIVLSPSPTAMPTPTVAT